MFTVMSTRDRRPEPVAIRILASQSVSRADAEQIITTYIDSTESSTMLDVAAEAAISAQGHSSNTVVDSIASAMARNENIIGQLKRVQRNLRGLPPVLRVEETGEQVSEATQKGQANEDVEMLNADDEDASVGSKRKQISAEERKRLKKERRKSEKRSKSIAAAQAAEDEVDEDDE